MHAGAMTASSASDSTEPQFAAVLLAAGLSRRMGGRNKLLAEAGGEAMARRCARVLLDSGLEVVAVTGHAREAVEAALAGLDVRLVFNPDYRAGQRASVRAGLAAVAGAGDAVLVALADQPFLTPGDIEALLDAYRRSRRDSFLVPYYRGRRGNPVVMPAALAEEITARPEADGQGPLTDLFPDRVERFEAPNDHYIRDIDTPAALRALEGEKS